MVLKVCQFSILPPSEVGGVESVVRDLTIHLNELGVETVSICGQQKYSGHLRSILSTRKIVEHGNHFDIINTHGYSGFGLSLVPKRFRSSKHVVTFHGTWVNYFNALGRGGGLLRKASIVVERRAMRDCDCGIAVSNWVKKSVVEQYGVDEDRISVVYNGVDCERFRPRNLGEKDAILWVGTNPELKGLRKAIKAANCLGVKLLVAGVKGRDTSNVRYLGRVKPEDMPNIYGMARLLILPSKYESFPSVVLEALASGLPAVVSPESHCEVLNDKCGIVTHDYVGAIRELLSRDLTSTSEECRKLAEKYRWRIQAEKYIKVYRRLAPV